MDGDRKIITISREFGSGGRSIGKMVAEKLGIGYYDKELVRQVAVETGFDEMYIEQEGEYAPGKSRFAFAFSARGPQNVMSGMSVDDFLWVIQRKVILELAEKEPCVIVGRCADYILQDRSDCLNVFVHAAMPARADRIVRLYGETEKSPEKRLEEKDKKRKIYYKHYTDQEWGMSQNYHLSLDTGVIGVEKSADIIVDLAGPK
jgi:cytidylate kinase